MRHVVKEHPSVALESRRTRADFVPRLLAILHEFHRDERSRNLLKRKNILALLNLLEIYFVIHFILNLYIKI